MSASGINWGHQRQYFNQHRICVCDPTNGDSCPRCDMAARDGSAAAEIRTAVAEVAARTTNAGGVR